MSNDQKVNDLTGQDLKKDTPVSNTKTEAKPESGKPTPSVAKSNIMDGVGLSREMMDRLAKEMK
ncbi:MAG: hypothetical protein EOP06_28660 [Proteobacteria bacterium]|nr:MAG: hypothetical protein EOP06_28660 [Pseudomonadota bacterium]